MPLNESVYRRKQREDEERRKREQAVEIARSGNATGSQNGSNSNSSNSSTTSQKSSYGSQAGSQTTPAEKALFKMSDRRYTDLNNATARPSSTGNTNKTRTLDRTNERAYNKYDTEALEKTNIRKNYVKERDQFRKEHPVGRWLGAEGNNAIWGLDAELAKGIDFFAPDVITPKFAQDWINRYKEEGEKAQKKVEEERAGSWERTLAGTVGGESIKNIPSATMAYLSGGLSTVPQVAGKAVPTLLNANELAQTGSVFTRALNQVAKDTGGNPMFWETFARTIGTTYENELQNGADPIRATMSAYTNALLNAQIEVGGGVEVYDPSEDFLKALARSAKEEGLEEVEQYAVENLVNKAMGSNTANWFSLTRGQDAVVNPVDMAEQGFYGALSGGLLSGGRTALVNTRAGIMDTLANPVSQEAIQEGMADQRGLVNRGLVQERDEGVSTKAKSIAQELQAQLDNGEELQPNQVKRLIREINKESNVNEQSLEKARIKEVGKSLDEGTFVEETGLNLEQEISKQKDSALESRSREKVRAILGENASENEISSVAKVAIGTANSRDIDTVLTKPSLKNAVAEIVNEGADADSRIQIPINNAEARTVLENLTAVKGIANRNAILKETQEENAEDIKALLTNLNSGGKDLFANHLAEGSNAIGDVYQNRFYRMYNEGRKDGADFEEAYDRLIAPLGSDVQAVFTRDFAQQIFAQGKASLATDNAKATAKSLADKYANRTSGLTFEDNDESLISESDKKGLETLAKAGNVEIRVMKNLTATDKDGKALLTKDGKELMVNGMYKDGTIYISANTKNKLVTVAKHELTHYIKEMSPERYKELEDFVLKKWYKNDPVAMAKRIEEYQRLYKDATPEEAREELIADASEAFFTDEATIEEAVSFSKKLGKAIHDGIKHILDAFTGDTRGYRGYGDFMKDLGILQEAERMWLEALEDTQQRKRNARGEVTADDYVDASTQYTTSDEKHSIVEDESLIQQLDNDRHNTTYRAMVLIDGKLYPPMSTKIRDANGKWKLQKGLEIGQWIESDITTDPKMFNSKGQFILMKDNGKPVPASYNPYIHSSDTMLNDQFKIAYKRPNLVVVEGEIPTSELTSGYKAEHDLDDGRHVVAKDALGKLQWKAGDVQAKLTGTRTVYLTRHFKPTRIVPDAEVARHIQKMVSGTDVAIPYNVVTPSLRQELLKIGVKMEQSKEKGYQVDLTKYSVTDEDFIVKDGKARWTEDRIDRLIEEYGAPHDNRYSKAYAVLMNPRQFLKLTLSDESLGKWDESARNMPEKLKGRPYRENVENVHNERLETGKWIHDNENYPLDRNELARQKQTPFLEISSDNGTMVDGHEGRHRMRALFEAGVEDVPVVIRDNDTKYTKDYVQSMVLTSQDFGRGAVNDGARVIVNGLIPIKASNRDELIQKFGGEADVKFSVSAEDDQTYLDAVNRGDMETAQKMVDERARQRGYDIKAYHGTGQKFTKFDRSKQGSNFEGYLQYGNGFYFATSEKGAKAWGNFGKQYGGDNVMSVYLKADRMLDITQEAPDWAKQYLIENGYSEYEATFATSNSDRFLKTLLEGLHMSNQEVQDLLISKGYDGIKELYRYGTGQLVVFYPVQIKSADPVTYDDNGEVIPLSKRFTELTGDIRYSVSEDSDGNQMTKAQADYFKDSKVRDSKGNLLVMYHGSMEDFTVFRKDKIREIDYDAPFNGFWFTSEEREADPAFRDARFKKKVYLNITNPAPYEVWRQVNKQIEDEWFNRAEGKGVRETARSLNDELRMRLQEMGYDGVHFDGAYNFTEENVREYNEKGTTTFTSAMGKKYDLRKSEYDDARLYPHNSWNEIIPYGSAEDFLEENSPESPFRNADVWVAFEPNQIKLTSNENPTEDKDIRYSLSSSFEAVGCDIRKEDGLIRAYDGNGNEVTKFKPSDIRKSPLGRLLSLAVGKRILSDSDVNQQVDFLSRLYNMILNTQDPDLIWAVSGTIGYDPKHGIGKTTGWLKEAKSKFASITGNADPQYKTTIDFTTICVKTQAIIDAMSKVMIDLGRGLTEHEIIDIVYKETARAGEQVPCPVCYVFSRWVGLGNLFGKIKEFQQDYPEDMDMTEVRKEYEAIKKEVDKLVKEQTGKKSSGKARDTLYKETIERKDLLDLKDQMPNKKLTEAEKKELEDLNRRLEVLDHWSWLEKTRLADDYKAVPDDVLFDLNAGRTFATDYPATWRFRTTRGPALGKAVAPYSPSRLGDTIRGIASPSTLAKLGNSKRVFLNPNSLTSTARKAYDKAIANAKRQNRMNGQRLQSTSDFRFEYGLDYLLSFIELEAIGAKAQMYTKVPEAVKFLASTGTEVNCSIMAKGSGLDENGELIFSDITGMAWEDALMLSQMYDNVQPILVAIGREHLIKAMAHKAITMIIPYHASGSSEGRYRSMMEAVGEAVEDRTDFAEFENEHDRDDATPEQKLCRKLRIDILTGKYEGKDLDIKEQNALKNNEILRQLYIRIYGKDINGKPAKPNRKYVENYDKDGNDSDCLGVYLTKEQAGVMMPYEYWDKHSTIKDADKQGETYIKYCESLGITPVFSGWDSKGKYDADMDFTSYTGYWKTLIDRCMYNNDGTYHKQQAVNVRNVDLDMLDSDEMKKGIFKPMQTQNTEMTETIAKRSEEAIAYEAQTGRASLSEVEDSSTVGRLKKENATLKEAVWKRNEQISAERMMAEIDVQKVKRHNAEVNKRAKERRDEAEAREKARRQAKRVERRLKKAESEERTKLLNIARRLSKVKTNRATRELIDSYIGELDLVAKSMTGKTVQKLTDLQAWYDKQVELDPFFKDSNVENKLKRLNQKQISQMGIEDVRDLTDVLRSIEASIRNGNKFVNSQYKKTVKEAGIETINDINKSTGIRKKHGTLAKLDRFFINGTLSPKRQIHRIVGYKDDDPMYIATLELDKGETEMLAYQARAWDMFEKFMDDKKFINSMNGKHAREISISCMRDGEMSSVKVTPDVAISLYLSSLNEDNMRHMGVGGVEIPDIKAYKKNDLETAFDESTRVTFSKQQLNEIKGTLNAKEKAFADTAYRYYNEVAPNAINTVSEILKGYSLAMVQNYFPINVNKDFINKDFESLKFDGTIEGMGSLKERVKANEPIYINGIVNTLTKSIDDNSKYVGLAIPVRNFNKLLGVKDMSFEKVDRDGRPELKITYNGSVQESINKKWGNPAMKYIENLMTDLQTNRREIDDWEGVINQLRSNYAGAVLTLNASVAIKQTASYPTAIAVLGFAPTIRAMGNFGRVNLNLIKKYTPLQWHRSRGYSSKELGDIRAGRKDSIVDKITSFSIGDIPLVGKYAPSAIRDLPLFNWIQMMDVLTTRKLWKASEYYVQMHNRSLKKGTDDYYKAVAEIYNRVIKETQPNYTVMQRPQLLRSKSAMVQSLNMFKTQPYQNFNILYDSIGNYVAKSKDYKANKGTVSKAEVKKAQTDMQNAVISQVLQLALFSSMICAWALFRGKDDKWRDEEGNLTIASFMKRLGLEMLSGSSAMLPLGSDIYSMISNKVSGGYYSGFQSVTDASINDLYNSLIDFVSLIGDALEYTDPEKREDIDVTGLLKQTDKVIKECGRFSGIPAQNIRNLFDATYRWTMISVDGKFIGEYEAMKITFAKDSDKKELLFKAYREDMSQYNELRKMMLDDGFDADKLDKDTKDRAKENKSESEQKEYDSSMSALESSPLWQNASHEDKDKYMKVIDKLSVGIEDSDTTPYTSRAVDGLTEEQVILYKLALKKVDKPNKNGNLGSYDKGEKEEALKLLEQQYNFTQTQKDDFVNGKW